MDIFINNLNWFAWGLVIGYFWHPVFKAIRTIYIEVQQARKEWRHHD
jgi:hypothetical protein